MQHKSRFIVLAIVLSVLALTIGPANAQAPEGPEVAACLPGSGYAPGCDVDQNGVIDIVDVQRTATRWNSSGVYTSGHDHFGQTWTGALDDSPGLYIHNDSTSGASDGIWGSTAGIVGWGVFGEATATSGGTRGVYGVALSTTGIGVFGLANSSTGTTYGVYGRSHSANGYAGYFQGRAHVTGTLSKGGGSFKIDHPLDPANQYLYHSFVESPDMMNVYNGNVTTDDGGFATVVLPDYFEALNRDFRYQLTVIGQFAQAIVAEEVQGNQFRIQTDQPGVKVSWQVTGIRQDAWANANRIPVEQDKPEGERGLYLHPEALGQPKDLGLDYQRNTDRYERPEVEELPDH